MTDIILYAPKGPCVDCGLRIGIHPALFDSPTGRVHRICQKCYNRWRPHLHADACVCPFCVYWSGVLASIPLTVEVISSGL